MVRHRSKLGRERLSAQRLRRRGRFVRPIDGSAGPGRRCRCCRRSDQLDSLEGKVDLLVSEQAERIQVRSHRAREQRGVLRHHDDIFTQVLQTDQADVDVVHQDFALFGFQCSEQRQSE